jgi:XTP/dITP diphosphohydrolase
VTGHPTGDADTDDGPASLVPLYDGQTQLDRLVAVMHALRRGCPWDAEQTHRSIVGHLIEETLEVVEAIEAGDDEALREELGDLLLQVMFHSEIAAETGRFDVFDVARGIGDKLISRHPYVFTDAEVPDDVLGAWEARKRAEKGRTSALEGIPERLSAVTRADKVIGRARRHNVPVGLSSEPVTSEQAGRQIVELVARAQASGVDAEQAVRDALRELETSIRQAERPAGSDTGAPRDDA